MKKVVVPAKSDRPSLSRAPVPADNAARPRLALRYGGQARPDEREGS
ncbi:hypothetical protein [Sphingomonas sp.]|jgi:hypothetical protein